MHLFRTIQMWLLITDQMNESALNKFALVNI